MISRPQRFDYAAIFFLSALTMLLELFLTRLLNLKTWNHVVYVIIPFAMLGYGVGTNLSLVFDSFWARWSWSRSLSVGLGLTGLLCILCPWTVAVMDIRVSDLESIIKSAASIGRLLAAYCVVMLPFTVIGFLVVRMFQRFPREAGRLYGLDLLGAGVGAVLFFVMINTLGLGRSLALMGMTAIALGIWCLLSRKIGLRCLGLVLCLVSAVLMGEWRAIKIDPSKGWEYIPGRFTPDQYRHEASRWHPLGRTDFYRIIDPGAREFLWRKAYGTFEINVVPMPEFIYSVTNYLGGTPIYHLEGLDGKGAPSHVSLFSQAMESPYLLFPRGGTAVVIGTGGGRDLFIARTHGAGRIIGAEINPAIYDTMMPGGRFHEYSGRVYTQEGTIIHNVDGRHLVKTIPPRTVDLIVLNGVDTYSGLSTGAYAYAESYLYTLEAVKDYWRLLKPNGVLNVNRWYFKDYPRETLRWFAIVLHALKQEGVERPWRHVVIGAHKGWSINLIKKTPFTVDELQRLQAFFADRQTELVFPRQPLELILVKMLKTKDPRSVVQRLGLNFFDRYALFFAADQSRVMEKQYPYDLSVVTDDSPFFYKYYKFNPRHIARLFSTRMYHTGTIVFLTQILVLLQAIAFIILFILGPLWLFKRKGLTAGVSVLTTARWVLYFACLGGGFMMIEIPLLQKFTLFLGSPIYSLSVTLTVLLAATGTGSLMFNRCLKTLPPHRWLAASVIVLSLLLGLFIFFSVHVFEAAMGWPWVGRVAVSALLLWPLGMVLGVFFPLGLTLISRWHPEAIPWVWGINMGFSVLGSISAIILAQVIGFNMVMWIALILYLAGWVVFRPLAGRLV